jgi:hypothetical protein
VFTVTRVTFVNIGGHLKVAASAGSQIQSENFGHWNNARQFTEKISNKN